VNEAIKALAEITSGDGALTPVGQATLRNRISLLEAEALKYEQADVPLQHHFSKDVYAREIIIKKDTVIVGAIHKFQNLNIISKGKVTFFSIDGAKTVEAPYTFVASPGVKRVIYAHEDTVWTTIHGTPEKDVDKIEDEFIAKNYEDVYLSSEKTLNDVLSIIGATHGELLAISENESDQISFDDNYFVDVRPSQIHGLGIFATKDFKAGDRICPARIGAKRTPAGRYSNHSGNPNGEIGIYAGVVYFYAKNDIACGDEILTDYYFNYKKTRGN
jgi:hypothetical protein